MPAINDNPIEANWTRVLLLARTKLITNSRTNSYTVDRENYKFRRHFQIKTYSYLCIRVYAYRVMLRTVFVNLKLELVLYRCVYSTRLDFTWSTLFERIWNYIKWIEEVNWRFISVGIIKRGPAINSFNVVSNFISN